ncbi:hypothetical protein DFH06DRAFT_288028 [Mycena polygramma]|nr:hypothetical protein DFH06DRAFT_288028 [Mycena polygramma]
MRGASQQFFYFPLLTISQLLRHSPSLSSSDDPGRCDTFSASSSSSSDETVSSIAEEKAIEAGISGPLRAPIRIDALRLVDLSNRTSAVLRSQDAEVLFHNDPIVAVLRTFGYLSRVIVAPALSVVRYDEFLDAIARHANDYDSPKVIIPWSRGAASVLDEEDGRPSQPF